MPETNWTAVEKYFNDALLHGDDALDSTLQSIVDAGMPSISVQPQDGKLLNLVARAAGASRILEVGTLGGYSTIWLARALPEGGRLVSLEINPHHAEVAGANVEKAGVADRVDIRVGPAGASLEKMVAGGEAPFDLVFIDADKPNNATYFTWALRLTHPGSLIVVDNVVREGRVVDAPAGGSDILGVRNLVDTMAAEPGVDVTVVQTVGSKGHDGFALALVTA